MTTEQNLGAVLQQLKAIKHLAGQAVAYYENSMQDAPQIHAIPRLRGTSVGGILTSVPGEKKQMTEEESHELKLMLDDIIGMAKATLKMV